MGIWQWICDAITGDANTGPSSFSTGDRSAHPTDGSSVAVLDPPETETILQEEAASWWLHPYAQDRGRLVLARPQMQPAEHALENLLASHLDGHDLTLPALPHVPATVLQNLRRSNWSAGSIADLIAEDQVVAGAVLRLANSPLYRGNDKIATLSTAIARLGARALRTLMMHVSVRGTLLSAGGANCPFAQALWRRSLATACLMQALCELTGLEEEDAFLLGLLHDVGDVMVLREVSDQHRASHGWPSQEVFDYYCQECHQEFGELIAAEWSLPPALAKVIADHHTYPAPNDPLRTQRLQLELADLIAGLLGYGPPATVDLLSTHAARDLQLAERPGIESFLTDLPDRIDEALNWTG